VAAQATFDQAKSGLANAQAKLDQLMRARPMRIASRRNGYDGAGQS
jgi:hypothetical protein